jgi:hypothetical protein
MIPNALAFGKRDCAPELVRGARRRMSQNKEHKYTYL